MIQTLSDALEQRGYATLTPVQEAVTNPELGEADMLVSAQTGSGKTVGFGLAIAPTLLGENDRFGAAGKPLALVIAPTRELALQVKRELDWLYAKAGAVMASCVGGMDMRDERRSLGRGAHIVVATPGRLRDHIQRGSLDMSAIRAVVLDEADEMLDLGFREDLEFILGEAPEERRTLLFSATVPRAIATLAQKYQRDSVRVSTTAERSQHSDIEYRAMRTASHDGENALINVLRYYEAPNAIVFCNTRAAVNRLTTRFSNRGFSVVALSGELSQTERSHALQSMRDGRARVCVATDVAARGIDLPNLELVIHADLPSNSETLLHRSGRTGRAGRKGVSALIVPDKFRKKAERLLKGAKINAQWGNPPTADEVMERDEDRLLSDPMWTDPATEAEQSFVSKMTDLHSPEKIAIALVRLYHSRQSAPEELAPAGAEPKPRNTEKFGPSVWLSVSIGRSQNAEPRRLLPMVCRAGDVTKDEIGAIRIQQNETFVEILKTHAEGFMAAVGPDRILEDDVKVTLLDKAPDLANMPRPSAPPRGGDRKFDGKPDRKPRGPKSDYKKDYDKKDYGKSERRDRDVPAPAHKPSHGPKSSPAANSAPKWQPDQGAPEGVERPKTREEKKSFDKPRSDAKPRHKSSGKPAGKYAGKPSGKPEDRSEPKSATKYGPRSDFKPGGKPPRKNDGGDRFEKPRGDRPASKGAPQDRTDASNTSKRFVPPGASAKPSKFKKPGAPRSAAGGKPRGKSGGSSVLTRGKPKRP